MKGSQGNAIRPSRIFVCLYWEDLDPLVKALMACMIYIYKPNSIVTDMYGPITFLYSGTWSLWTGIQLGLRLQLRAAERLAARPARLS